jgi:hypothetical protein
LRNFFSWRYVYRIWPLEYIIKKPPVPRKRVTIILIKVKSCNVLLPMLLVYIHGYLTSVTSLKFWIPIIQTLYLQEQKCEEPGYFSEPKGVREKKCLGSTVKSNCSSAQKGMSKGTFFDSLHQALYLKTYVSFVVSSDIDLP